MDVKRRGRPSGCLLLDEDKLSAGLLGSGLHGRQHPEKPEGFPILGAERVGVWVAVHTTFLPDPPERRIDTLSTLEHDAIHRGPVRTSENAPSTTLVNKGKETGP